MNNYDINDLQVGMKESFTVRITEEMMTGFRRITGDENPLHTDEDYAREQGYDQKVCYGMLTASFLSKLAGVYLPGKRSLIHSVETKFLKPVYPGDELLVEGMVEEVHESVRQMGLKVTITRGNGEKVLKGRMKIGIQGDRNER